VADEKMRLGKVPESVYQKRLKEYLNPRGDDKKSRASFRYNGETYSIHADGRGGWKLDPQARRTEQQAQREGRKRGQEVKLSSAEKMMVDNYYQEASRRGLQVDHRIPLDKGGPSNAPWNLGLMTKRENQSKSNRIGGNWKYQPLIDSPAVNYAQQRQMEAKAAAAIQSIANPGPASQQIRGMMNAAPDVIQFQPGQGTAMPGI
jgi:hypothetical protein